ncbi:hypothetical protein BDW75DRAFT_34232 [Aspergillus navahoensis]
MASSTAAAAPQPPVPSLALPPSQFARLQPHAYLLAHLSPPASSQQPSIRANGRSPSQFRITSANTGSLTHTNGSAVVRVGDTTAVCGIKAEILHTEDIASWSVSHSSSSPSTSNKRRKLTNPTEKPGEDCEDGSEDEAEENSYIEDFSLLVPNLSLSTGCAPGFIPGAPPSGLAQSLSHQILSLLHSSRLVCAKDLEIWYRRPNFGAEELERHNEGEKMDMDAGLKSDEDTLETREIKAFWVLYIDIMIISLAGNPFDAAWTAVLAALRDTKLPRAWWDADNETVVCSDLVAEARKLSLRGLPVASSFGVFEADAAAGWRAIIIPDVEEERKLAEGDRKGIRRRWILADPDGYEEELTHESVCLVVDKTSDGKVNIMRMVKNGGFAVDRRELKELVEISARRWDDINQILGHC